MEATSTVVSFVGLAAPVAQGLKFLYDFTTDMKDCPKDIREMKTDLELVEDLISQVIRQCNERDTRMRESVALARAIRHARESVEDLKKEMAAYLIDGKRTRFKFAAKVRQTQKLRASLDRTKTIMFEFKAQLQSDLLYDIRDTSEEVLRSVEKTNRDLEKHDRNFHKDAQQLDSQAKATSNSEAGAGNSTQLTNDTSSEGMTDIKLMAQKLERITDLLTETRISPSPASTPSTPALSREVSEVSTANSSQETSASSISSSPSIPRPASQKSQQSDIVSKHPLLQFKDKPFEFLIAIIFTQRTSKHNLACQRAAECLAAYPTPEALAQASPEALKTYFSGMGLQNTKPPQLIKLSKAYIKNPPEPGKLFSKAWCPASEISHLPQMGLQAVNTWLVYHCENTDVVTDDGALLEYMEFVKSDARRVRF